MRIFHVLLASADASWPGLGMDLDAFEPNDAATRGIIPHGAGTGAVDSQLMVIIRLNNQLNMKIMNGDWKWNG